MQLRTTGRAWFIRKHNEPGQVDLKRLTVDGRVAAMAFECVTLNHVHWPLLG